MVKNGTILAVEGFDGTDETIRRGGALAHSGAVVIKVSKPNHDTRFDVPVVGPKSLQVAVRAKFRVIAVEAGRTLLLDKELLQAAAGSSKVSLFGVSES